MAKAALEALSGFNLFGARGSQRSVIHISPDNIAQADLTLTSMLPRESHSKEIDAALLSVIGFPAFAVHNAQLCERTRDEIIAKLEGRYGLKRFLRDGHQTVLEDEGRLHYEPTELKRFENIESEWPLFFAYLHLDAIFRGDVATIRRYERRLESVLVERDGQRLLPELYYVPCESIEKERKSHGSSERVPNDNVPLVWAQSLHLLGRMIRDGVLRVGDIDPLGRRHHKRTRQPVVQIVVLAEDEALQGELLSRGIKTETTLDIEPVKVFLPQHIAAAHAQVGRNDAMGLGGRAARVLKSLTTSRIYKLRNDSVVCLASFFIQQEFFLAYDMDFLLRRFESELIYLQRNWTEVGRPTVTVLVTHSLLDSGRTAFLEFMQRVDSGRIGDVAVKHARLNELLPTACFERITELHDLSFPDDQVGALVSHASVLTAPGRQTPLAGGEELDIELSEDQSSLLSRLEQSDNLYESIEILAALRRTRDLTHQITVRGQRGTLFDLLEEVYEEAGRLQLWAVVRRAAGLLGKVDGDLVLAVGAILLRQKSIQVGRAYSDDSTIAHPIPEHEILQKIVAFGRDDVRDRVLTQELILYLSLLIRAQPDLFSELLTIRVGQLINLLTGQLAQERAQSMDEAYEQLMHLAPSQVQSRLEAVLARRRAIERLPQQLEQLDAHSAAGKLAWKPDTSLERLEGPEDGWFAWRQHRGIIDRRPTRFYADVWNIFKHTPALTIGDHMERRNRMDSAVVLSDMTPGERAFALRIEHLLNKVQAPEYRQLNVEALEVLANFFKQNPSLVLDDALSLDALIGHAVMLSYLSEHPEHDTDYNEHKAQAWDSFYASTPAQVSGAIAAALRHLLTVRATGT